MEKIIQTVMIICIILYIKYVYDKRCFINISYSFIHSAIASLYCQAKELRPVTHQLWSSLYNNQSLKSHSYALQFDEQGKTSF